MKKDEKRWKKSRLQNLPHVWISYKSLTQVWMVALLTLTLKCMGCQSCPTFHVTPRFLQMSLATVVLWMHPWQQKSSAWLRRCWHKWLLWRQFEFRKKTGKLSLVAFEHVFFVRVSWCSFARGRTRSVAKKIASASWVKPCGPYVRSDCSDEEDFGPLCFHHIRYIMIDYDCI